MMNPESILSSLNHFNDLFQQNEDDREVFDDEMASIPNMDAAAYLTFLERRAQTRYGRVFAEFRSFVVSGLCRAYLNMDIDERDTVLGLIGSRRVVKIGLWKLLDEYRWRFSKSSREEKINLFQTVLLIAVLVEDYLDDVETTRILTSVWGAAEESGLDPVPYFKSAALVAGRRKLTHGQTASEVLREFEPYDYGW